MLTLQKWLTINQKDFAVNILKQLVAINPLEYNAIVTEDGPVCIYYSTTYIYFDVHIFPDGTFEWFWRNRLTNDCDSTIEGRETEFSESLKEKLGKLDA